MRRALLVAASLVLSGVAAAPPAAAAPMRGTSVVCPPDRLPPLPFVDARTGTEVACGLGLGLVRGRTSTVLDPAAGISRGHVAVLLVRAAARAGVDLPRGSQSFSDLDGTTPEVQDAVSRVAEAGITRGHPDGTFRPAALLPRDQAASFVERLQRRLGGPLPAPQDCFDDAAGTHEDAIGRMCALGVVQGTAPRRYSPAALLSRAQLAATLVRLLDVDAEAGLVEPLAPVPAWSASAAPVQASQVPASHRPGCPVALADLRFVTLRHWGFDGRTHLGELVLHADAVAAVTEAFRRMYEASVVVEQVRLVDAFGADDDRSMAANNTSAYNCRTVGGSTTWSQHAYGRAVDVNPVQNPYVTRGGVEPEAGRAYLDRGDVRPGMAVAGGPVVEAFRAVGWGWGGTFTSSKDYQHFSANGR